MGRRATAAGRMVLPAWCALSLLLLALAMVLALLRPGPSLAQSGEKWFTVHIYTDGTGIIFPETIQVYRDGKASASSRSVSGNIETTYEFSGIYSSARKSLSGSMERHEKWTSGSWDGWSYLDEYECDLQGTLTDSETMEGTITGKKWKAKSPGEPVSTESVDEEFSGGVTGLEDEEESGDDDDDAYGDDEDDDEDFYDDDDGGYDYDDDDYGYDDESGSDASKVPGPGSWGEWAVGTAVAGIITAGIGLISSLFGSVPPPPDVTDAGEPPPSLLSPYSEYPGGPLIYPPGTEPAAPPAPPPPPEPPPPPLVMTPENTPDLFGPSIRPGSSESAPLSPEAGGMSSEDIGKAAGDSLLDTGGALLTGTGDFLKGFYNTVKNGYEEAGLLVFEATDARAPGVFHTGDPRTSGEPFGSLIDATNILANTGVNIIRETLEGLNPMEEIKSLFDPNMSWEGAAWAVASAALKGAEAVLLYDSVKEMIPRTPREPLVPRPKEVGSLDPAARTPRMTVEEAVTKAENTVSREGAVEYTKYREKVKANVEKVNNRDGVRTRLDPEEVGNLQRDPGTVRDLLGKGGKDAAPVTPEARGNFQNGRREVYDAADRPTIDKLKQRPEYSEGDIKVREVSTSGEADAAVRSTDRDHMYVIERTVKGPDGKMVKVEEPIPVEKWAKDYNKHYAEATRYDPADPLPGYTEKQWRRMTLEERWAANAEQSGQNPMGRTSREFIVEKRLDRGPGRLTSDPEWTGRLETDKFRSQWSKGDAGSRGEALKQLDKAGDAAREAAAGSGKALDEQTLKALDVVKQGGDPAVVDQAVRNLGVNGGVEGLNNRLGSVIEWSKFAPK